jgi:hypothetical protein
MKYFFPHQLFGKREAYTKEMTKASLEKLAHLIKVCRLPDGNKSLLILGKIENAISFFFLLLCV